MATPKDKFKFKKDSQVRTLTLSPVMGDGKRFDTEYYVEGYATTFEPYLLYDDGDWGKVYERFDPHCFDECDMSDVIMQYDHAGRVFARTTNNTLIVETDDKGLFIAADLSKTDRAKDLHGDIVAQMITKMSWRFRVGSYYVERTEGSKDITIVHTKIPKIYDVSAVSIPANPDTTINARSFVDGVIAELARRDAELEDRKRKLKLKIKLEETKL